MSKITRAHSRVFFIRSLFIRKFLAEANLKRVMERGNANHTPEERGEVCALMFDQLVTNCIGDTYLCCAFPNYDSFKIGKYLELSEHEILLRRRKHAFCRSCTLPRRPGTEHDRTRLLVAGAVVDLEKRLQAANEELARAFASKSWRLTTPLRAVRCALDQFRWRDHCGPQLRFFSPTPATD